MEVNGDGTVVHIRWVAHPFVAVELEDGPTFSLALFEREGGDFTSAYYGTGGPHLPRRWQMWVHSFRPHGCSMFVELRGGGGGDYEDANHDQESCLRT